MILSRGGMPQNVQVPYPVVRVRGGKELHFECCTRTWVDLIVHWNGKGTQACPRTNECKACLSGAQEIWAGYLIGWYPPTDKKLLVPITPLAADCLDKYDWRKASLWGARITLKRLGESDKSPLFAWIKGWNDDAPFIGLEALERSVKTIYKIHRKGALPAEFTGRAR